MKKHDGGRTIKMSKADSLMNEADSKKRQAKTQERLGNIQIKNKVKPNQTGTLGDYTGKIRDAGKKVPVGKERLDIAKKLRKDATADSMMAVKARKEALPLTPKSSSKMPAPRKAKK